MMSLKTPMFNWWTEAESNYQPLYYYLVNRVLALKSWCDVAPPKAFCGFL